LPRVAPERLTVNTRIGFIGLGQMGKWMALNLRKAGFPLTILQRNPEAVRLLTEQDASAVATPAEMAECSEWVFLCLPNAAVVEQILFDETGLVRTAGPDLIVVDCGTTDYVATLDFARRLSERSIRFVDAPVSGMEARAQDGTLTIMCGGPAEVIEQVRPALDAMGSTIIHMGGVGSGQLAKLVNQLLFNINLAALAEVLPMAVKLGLDPQLIAQIVTTGTARSFAAEFFIPNILEGRFDQGYPLQRAYKDMISAAEISARQQIPLPLVHAATTTYQIALRDGLGDLDKGAMIKIFERILGVEFRKDTGIID
jgi:3-hydroxyisobutyrate dehydrogenase-like beta-hydroxyacid dehydrogenase